MKIRHCKDCPAQHSGNCYLNPPVFTGSTTNEDGFHVAHFDFPEVDEVDWCWQGQSIGRDDVSTMTINGQAPCGCHLRGE